MNERNEVSEHNERMLEARVEFLEDRLVDAEKAIIESDDLSIRYFNRLTTIMSLIPVEAEFEDELRELAEDGMFDPIETLVKINTILEAV
jgi:hypothetical protein